MEARMETKSPIRAFKGVFRDYVFAIAVAAALALMVRGFVVEAFRIPTDFMAPTLLPGDNIFVTKFGTSRVGRGDVIIFSFPADPRKDFVKRVIGVAGDKVEIRGGEVFINAEKISRSVSPG